MTKADVQALADNDTTEANVLDYFADLANLDGNPLKGAQLRAQADQERANAEGWQAIADEIAE